MGEEVFAAVGAELILGLVMDEVQILKERILRSFSSSLFMS